jgi:transposase
MSSVLWPLDQSERHDELARCRSKLEWAETELRRERRERGEHITNLKAKLTETIGMAYRGEIARLAEQLTTERLRHQQEVADLRSEFAARTRAYEAKIQELASALALYNDGRPARTGSDKIDGTKLSPRRPPKPRSNHHGGRKIPKNLPTHTERHPLPCSACPNCGKHLKSAKPAVSHEVQFKVTVELVRHERERCSPCECGWCGPVPADTGSSDVAHTADRTTDATVSTAASTTAAEATINTDCPDRPDRIAEAAPPATLQPQALAPTRKPHKPLLIAPLPPKLMAGAMCCDRSWIEIMLLKYMHQVSLSQIAAMFESEGYRPHSGTLCDGIARLRQRLLVPLVQVFTRSCLSSPWWAADASSLRMVEKGRTRTHGVVWQVRGETATVFFYSETAEAIHIQNFFASVTDTSRTLLADRAATFQTLTFLIAFCWAHVRRDFIQLGRYVPGNRTFACEWLQYIRRLYRLHRAWRLSPDEATHDKLRRHLEMMAQRRDAELARDDLPEPRRKVLQSLQNHWPGLIRVLDDIRLPLDNNEVERNFRPLARLRHNSQACHSRLGAETAMDSLTVIHTLKQNQVPVKPYLLAWCDAMARNGGNAPDITPWLPWQLSDDVKQRIAHFRAI